MRASAVVRGSSIGVNVLVGVLVALPSIAWAQDQPRPSAWEFTVSIGGYARGNRAAVTSWLAHNAYGSPEPKHCGFDSIFRTVCDDPVAYPKTSHSDLLGWTLGVGRRVTDRLAIDVFGATEQSGTVVGRCDDLATPRDPRCTNRFLTVEFGGASAAALGVVSTGHLHLGAGPAMMLANWDMRPAHLPGLWLDATYGAEGFPLFAHAQYRFYQAAGNSTPDHFTGFHPSTLYVGMGFTVRVDDSPH